MGAYLSKKIGSDPYYASYERSFERLKSETDRLKIALHRRKARENYVGNTIFFYGAVGFALAVIGAAWVVQQPAGTYTAQQHSARVAPLFVEPVLACAVYWAVLGGMRLFDRRDRARLDGLNRRLRKMVAELKDSTRYEKTQGLLQKYDPDYEPPTPRKLPQPQQPALRHPPGRTPAAHQGGGGPGGRRRSTAGALSHIGDAAGIASLMPAFDRLATALIGDNPALTEALRAARLEAEQLKGRVASAEARIGELQRTNAQLRAQLGLAPDPDQAPAPALPWLDETAVAQQQQQHGGAAPEGIAELPLLRSEAEEIGAGGVVIEEVCEAEVLSSEQHAEAAHEHGHTQPAADVDAVKQDTKMTDID